ncbi:MAG TPA: glycosyltransferase family 2 protein, partial [Bryobacteraceae bacterium]|nr:glycosyltransferase family 2 protein [Bryobacteraceae bacterium]
MARVAIVIVTYNSADEVGGCLDALHGLPDTEILVVDNASTDATREEVRRRHIALIANNYNAGFAAAVNQGIRATTAPLVLLLNPDAHFERGLEHLEAEFRDPRTGAAGGLLTGPDGRPQTGFMARNLPTPATLIFEVLGINSLWPGNRVNWHYRCLEKNPVTPGLVEQPAGAFLMFPRGIWEQVGGFDERFWPVWFEDVDFCAKLKQAGFLVHYNPRAVAKHTGGHAVGVLALENRERYWYGSLLEYAAKYFRPLAFRSVC